MSNNNGIGEMAGQVPLCTLCFATLCIGLQVYGFLFATDLDNYVLIPSRVIYLGEYYRIITAALLHSGLMHIVFNMMSFLSIGSGLEMACGSLSLLFTILWSMVLAGVIHCGAEWAMTVWITHNMQYVNQASVGFSGVIFTLALLESYRSTQPTRSVFGMIQVPTRIYPWVLLVLLSVFMPGISFMGHLSGILVGVMHVYGLTKPLMPSAGSFIEMESYGWVQNSIGQRHNFIPCPQPLLPTTVDDQQQQIPSAGGPWHSFCGPPLAAIGAGRRSLSSWVHGVIGRLRGRSPGAVNDSGNTAVGSGTGISSEARDSQDRGRLLPWGA
ncbi:unnamed protein product [Pylaiella littoralis]